MRSGRRPADTQWRTDLLMAIDSLQTAVRLIPDRLDDARAQTRLALGLIQGFAAEPAQHRKKLRNTE